MSEQRNAIAVKLAEMMAAHRDGMDGSDCSGINDPGSCEKCATLDAAIKVLLSALPGGEAAAPAGWQPIETAPKYGTPILIWAESPATRARRTYRAWWAIPYDGAPDSAGWWETAYPQGHSPVVPEFVRGWMPLPSPPAASAPSAPTPAKEPK